MVHSFNELVSTDVLADGSYLRSVASLCYDVWPETEEHFSKDVMPIITSLDEDKCRTTTSQICLAMAVIQVALLKEFSATMLNMLDGGHTDPIYDKYASMGIISVDTSSNLNRTMTASSNVAYELLVIDGMNDAKWSGFLTKSLRLVQHGVQLVNTDLSLIEKKVILPDDCRVVLDEVSRSSISKLKSSIAVLATPELVKTGTTPLLCNDDAYRALFNAIQACDKYHNIAVANSYRRSAILNKLSSPFTSMYEVIDKLKHHYATSEIVYAIRVSVSYINAVKKVELNLPINSNYVSTDNIDQANYSPINLKTDSKNEICNILNQMCIQALEKHDGYYDLILGAVLRSLIANVVYDI